MFDGDLVRLSAVRFERMARFEMSSKILFGTAGAGEIRARVKHSDGRFGGSASELESAVAPFALHYLPAADTFGATL